jgi:hypothetical protein
MNRYRFTHNGTTWEKNLPGDDAALQYASGATDGPDMVIVEKWSNGDWLQWDCVPECWVFSPSRAILQ